MQAAFRFHVKIAGTIFGMEAVTQELQIRRRRLTFAHYAWAVLAYNLLVVLWGAVVRASVSGDGCGKHWPFCDGKLIPHFGRLATGIEFAHRVSSGLVLPLIFILIFWAFRQFPKGAPVRTGAKLALAFTFSEALLGAGLVLFGLVAHNNTVTRAIVMSAHLVNTFLLLMSLTLTAWWGSGGRPLRLRGQGAVGMGIAAALLAVLVLAISGSVTALIDTLYPSSSLYDALKQDLFPGVHYLIRLRLLHPAIAITVSIYVLFAAGMSARLRPTPDSRRFARSLSLLIGMELAVGFLNVLLLAPMWMQLVHLLLADLLWVNLILLSASVLSGDTMPSFIPESIWRDAAPPHPA